MKKKIHMKMITMNQMSEGTNGKEEKMTFQNMMK